jgi:hypothetical protein
MEHVFVNFNTLYFHQSNVVFLKYLYQNWDVNQSNIWQEVGGSTTNTSWIPRFRVIQEGL